jgi:hypothetical protein
MERVIAPPEEIVKKLEMALSEHGIKVVEAGDYTVAFVE